MTAAVVAGLIILGKASVIAFIALAADTLLRRLRVRGRRLFVLLPSMLLALPLVELLMPSWFAPVARLPHETIGAPIASNEFGLSWASVLLVVWAIGVCFSLSKFAHGWIAARRIARNAVSITDARMLDVMTRATSAMNMMADSPRLVLSQAIQSPAVFGWRRPVLLLPTIAEHWSSEDLYGVLCHELSHVRHRDWLCHALEQVAAAMYWPNPFVRMLWHRTARRREMAADRAALDAGTTASRYATHLIAVARACRGEPLAAGVAFAARPAGELGERVHMLFSPVSRATRVRSGAGAGVTILLAFATAAIAAVKPIECVPPNAASSAQSQTESCP